MITADDLERVPLFAAMTPELRARIASRSAEIRANVGEWISHEGDTAYFWTMLEGEVERVKIIAGEEVQVTTFDAGEYYGEVPLMLGTESFSAIRAIQPTRIMRTEAADFHLILTDSIDAAAIIAQTLNRRVNFIGNAFTAQNMRQAIIIGGRLDILCHGIREFLLRNQISFEWLDPADASDAPLIPIAARDAAAYPIVVLANGRVIKDPDSRGLAQALNLQTVPKLDAYDVLIVGGGPAGLAAAVYGGSEGLQAIMIEAEAPGGQAGTSSRIENYLGFPGGISGGDLANRALQQAKRFGTEILVTRWVCGIEPREGCYAVTLDGGDVIMSRSIVLATGVKWRELSAEGSATFIGRGIYYGAARTEALSVRGKNVFLIGGGNSAGQAAMFFSSYALSVTILIRGENLQRSMSHYLIEQLAGKENIRVETRTTLVKTCGGLYLESLTTRDEVSGATRERAADALFVFIGADAETAWMPSTLERDSRGYVRTGRDVESWQEERPPFALETSMPGVFAAGDVRSASVKRVASGVGEGSMVIAYIHQYLETQRAAEPLAVAL